MPTPIDTQRLAERMQGTGDAATRGTAGQRFARGRLVAEARKGSGKSRGVTIPEGNQTLLSGRDLIGTLKLRTYSNLLIFDIDGVPKVSVLPAPARVPSLVETIITTKPYLELGDELTQQITADGALDGTPLVEPAMNFGSTPTPTILPRFGLALPIARSVLDDENQVASLLDARLQRGITLGLELKLLAGSSTDPTGTGILNVSGTTTVAKGGSDVYRLDTVARGVSAVQGLGWYERPLQAVAHPTTLEAMRVEKDTVGHYAFRPQAITPDIEAWVPSTAVPVGSAIVGDFFNGAVLFLKDGLTIEVSTQHLDFLKRDMLMWSLATRAYAWIRNPSAFAICTGL